MAPTAVYLIRVHGKLSTVLVVKEEFDINGWIKWFNEYIRKEL